MSTASSIQYTVKYLYIKQRYVTPLSHGKAVFKLKCCYSVVIFHLTERQFCNRQKKSEIGQCKQRERKTRFVLNLANTVF